MDNLDADGGLGLKPPAATGKCVCLAI